MSKVYKSLGLFSVLSIVFLSALSIKASTYSSGTLLALENKTQATVYYLGADNKKYAFPDSKTYFSYYDNFDNVIRVNLATLDSYPDGGTMPYKAGTKLITHQNTAKVYAVEPAGLIRWIPTEEIAINLYGTNWSSRVQDVIPGFFATTYTLGPDLSDTLPTGTIVKDKNTNTYYYIDNGQKRISTQYQNYHSEDIVELDDLSNYPDRDSSSDSGDNTTSTPPVTTLPGGGGGGSSTPSPTPVDNDLDNDGYDSVSSGGNDCNDSSSAIHPGATEICGDSIDQDCSGSDLSCPVVDNDLDNDGYDSVASGGNDCNDNSSAIHPGVTEICGDSIDQDCSGSDLSCPSSGAELMASENFEDSDWTDNFSRAVNEANVSMSSDVAMGNVSARMYGGYLGASFDYIFADDGYPNAQDGDKYYVRYYTYYEDSVDWTNVSLTGWKQFRGMPPDGWPLVTIKFGESVNYPDLFTHSYFEALSDNIPDRRAMARPTHNTWHLHEYYLSYSSAGAGGYAWYIDGVLVAGVEKESMSATNWPRNTGTPVYEVNGFRFAGGNGAVPNSVYYVDNIEIWKGWP